MKRAGIPQARRLSPALRRAAILQAAVTLAQTQSYRSLCRADIAQLAGVAEATVQLYFKAPALRQAVMQQAISQGVLPIVAEGLIVGDPVAQNSKAGLRTAVKIWVLERLGE